MLFLEPRTLIREADRNVEEVVFGQLYQKPAFILVATGPIPVFVVLRHSEAGGGKVCEAKHPKVFVIGCRPVKRIE